MRFIKPPAVVIGVGASSGGTSWAKPINGKASIPVKAIADKTFFINKSFLLSLFSTFTDYNTPNIDFSTTIKPFASKITASPMAV